LFSIVTSTALFASNSHIKVSVEILGNRAGKYYSKIYIMNTSTQEEIVKLYSCDIGHTFTFNSDGIHLNNNEICDNNIRVDFRIKPKNMLVFSKEIIITNHSKIKCLKNLKIGLYYWTNFWSKPIIIWCEKPILYNW